MWSEQYVSLIHVVCTQQGHMQTKNKCSHLLGNTSVLYLCTVVYSCLWCYSWIYLCPIVQIVGNYLGEGEISHSYWYNVIFQLSTNSCQLFEQSDIDISTRYNILFLECTCFCRSHGEYNKNTQMLLMQSIILVAQIRHTWNLLRNI